MENFKYDPRGKVFTVRVIGLENFSKNTQIFDCKKTRGRENHTIQETERTD